MDMKTEDPRIGTVLNGRYRIIERIAAGGMAVVYRGERVELGRPVAVKFLQEIMLQYPKLISRFEAEARAMSKLSHPYCVSVIDFGVDVAPYIVMDYVEGRTLKAVSSSEAVTPTRAVTLVRQILAGIAHAHSQGIVHRDIKPENIMLQDSVGVGETVRIFDFGLAKLQDAAVGSLSMSSLVAGTPNYMSPEQSRGKKVDARTDLYSICVVLFELLTGRKPFVHEDFIEVVRMHREVEPPRLNDIAGHGAFSEELEAVVQKALAKEPTERFQTAEAFAAALEETPEGFRAKETEMAIPPDPRGKTLPIGAKSPYFPSTAPTTMFRPDGFRKRYPRMFRLLVAASVLMLGAGTAGMLILSKKRPPATIVVSSDSDKETVTVSESGSDRDTKDVVAVASAVSTDQADDTPSADTSASDTAPETDAASDSDNLPSEPEVRTVKDARLLIKAGERERALAGLNRLRRDQPKNAQIVLLIGELYFEKVWWADALDHYAVAIRLNPAYKKKISIQRDVIATLGSDKTFKKASYVLHKVLGKAALPQLRRAAKRDESAVIRRRAATLVKKIQQG